MYARDELHPGLILMPGEFGRDHQQQFVRGVVDWIVNAAEAGEAPADFMLNKLVEVDYDGACTVEDLLAR